MTSATSSRGIVTSMDSGVCSADTMSSHPYGVAGLAYPGADNRCTAIRAPEVINISLPEWHPTASSRPGTP
ncbi:hypothetical protein SY2F82_69720 [Streptomyces sp. Y2F8-2]|nr:hypothetical protein SY2F82_69720 [Streptomyces sp. Y2F8-2]